MRFAVVQYGTQIQTDLSMQESCSRLTAPFNIQNMKQQSSWMMLWTHCSKCCKFTCLKKLLEHSSDSLCFMCIIQPLVPPHCSWSHTFKALTFSFPVLFLVAGSANRGLWMNLSGDLSGLTLASTRRNCQEAKCKVHPIWHRSLRMKILLRARVYSLICCISLGVLLFSLTPFSSQ